MGDEHNNRASIPVMLAKLDEFFIKEKELEDNIKKLFVEYNQLKEDIELLQNMIMHQSNKNRRGI